MITPTNHAQLTCLAAVLVHMLAWHSRGHQDVSMQWQEAGIAVHV